MGWKYSRGTVVGEERIAEVLRNYAAFPFLFVEEHSDGHDYLVCGADYQGQTVIDLCCGRRRDYLPPEAEKGHGFCWSEFEYQSTEKLLVVCGCIWACDYEYRFFDFSSPQEGWPELGLSDEEWIEAGEKAPEVQRDGSIICFDTRRDGDKAAVVATTTLTRTKAGFEVAGTWVDPAEQDRRNVDRRAMEARAAEEARYKAENPMYGYVITRSAKAPFDLEEPRVRIGRTFDAWCPDAVYDDARIILRLAEGKSDDAALTLDLEWGMREAPVKLVVFYGSKTETLWFPHSVDGIGDALDVAANRLMPSLRSSS
ncbi:MAG: hypothetical protein ACI9KE_001324 [Polyangiales bacterium]|jgi:hypothetical protein